MQWAIKNAQDLPFQGLAFIGMKREMFSRQLILIKSVHPQLSPIFYIGNGVWIIYSTLIKLNRF
jgi:hypothetical protein